MIINKIKLTIKRIWNFLIGISNIGSCFFAATSCYIASIAVLEVFNLNVEINQIVEKSQKDSVVIIERPVPISVPQDSSLENRSGIRQDNRPVIEQNTESDDSPYLTSTEIDEIRRRRDEFLKRMRLLWGNRKYLQ